MLTLLRKLIGFTIIIASFLLAWQLWEYDLFNRLPLKVSEQGQRINILPGTPFKLIVRSLSDNGIITKPRLFEWGARLKGKASKVQAGEYHVPYGMLPNELLDMFVAGKVVQYSFTLVEGWNLRQTLNALKQNPDITHTLTSTDAEKVMQELGLNVHHAEGWFFPDTYNFVRNTSDVALLKRAYAAMKKQLDEQWLQRDAGLPYMNPYQALIMASIIEKETGVAEERQQISGVFVRRLKKGMRLQTDPTVIYGIGESYDGNIRRKDLRSDTPYNTYTRKGLPPTPIAMPGQAAIYAALHPADGDSLYFVASGNGAHVFSSTLQQHNEAVIKYQLKGKRREFSSYSKNKNQKGQP